MTLFSGWNQTHRTVVLVSTCVLILALAAAARSQNLAALHPFEADERLWLLMGASLIQTGVPASWTIYWEKYDNMSILPLGGQEHVVVTPFLDHPPLFGLGMGLWAALTGNNTPAPFNWAILRIPMIFISLASLIMTALLLRRLFGASYALTTLVAFAFFPAHVIASRFIVAENLIAALLMAAIYALAVIDTTQKPSRAVARYAAASIYIICGSAALLKLSGLAIPASLCFIALLRKKWRLAAGIALSAAVSLIMLALWGAYYDWSIFSDVLGGHTGRPQSFWHFWSILTQLDLGYFPLPDPSLIVGFIGLFALLANPTMPWSRRAYIFAPLFVFSLLFLFVAPVESYGWYKYAFFPLLAIGIGYVLTELIRGRYVYYALLLPWLAVLLAHSQLLTSHNQQRLIIFILYSAVAAAIILKQNVPRLKLLLPALAGVLIAIVFLLELTWTSQLIA